MQVIAISIFSYARLGVWAIGATSWAERIVSKSRSVVNAHKISPPNMPQLTCFSPK